ncbi:MAG: FeoB-associated Cys-rich membrane protein [Erysipelotrichaceae bacterium]|nr:FeoB-associated Cys-rich membrane protein [Erysipelotrichaceae bacterium]
MFFLKQNAGTILVLLVLIAVVALIIKGMIDDRKHGRTSCSHGCSNCALHGSCHRIRTNNKQKYRTNS